MWEDFRRLQRLVDRAHPCEPNDSSQGLCAACRSIDFSELLFSRGEPYKPISSQSSNTAMKHELGRLQDLCDRMNQCTLCSFVVSAMAGKWMELPHSVERRLVISSWPYFDVYWVSGDGSQQESPLQVRRLYIETDKSRDVGDRWRFNRLNQRGPKPKSEWEEPIIRVQPCDWPLPKVTGRLQAKNLPQTSLMDTLTAHRLQSEREHGLGTC